MAYYRPATAGRQEALGAGGGAGTVALLFVDVQRYNCSTEGALFLALSEQERASSETCYFYARVGQISSNWSALQRAGRWGGGAKVQGGGTRYTPAPPCACLPACLQAGRH